MTELVVQRWLGFKDGEQTVRFRTFHMVDGPRTLCGKRTDRKPYREPHFDPLEPGEAQAFDDKTPIPEWEHGLCRQCVSTDRRTNGT